MYRFGKDGGLLGQKMAKIRDRRGSAPDPEAIDKEFKGLRTCHQRKGGPCKLTVTKDPDDQRCRMSKRMSVSCQYLGKVDQLKDQVRQNVQDEELDVLIYEPPPKVSV